MVTINIPDNVQRVLSILDRGSYEGFIVGGCVRDSLLGREPKDWDVCTNAQPDSVVKLFVDLGYRVIPTGLKHGTVTVISNDEHIEVTTYRVDGEYEDNRRPSGVTFTGSLIDDLSRRDFTINSMAYNSSEGLIDEYGGYKHLVERKIVAVGDPDVRFKEDSLRMMRAIRFSSQIGFEIEDKTFLSMKENNDLIKNISAERIRDELIKIVVSDNSADGIRSLSKTGILEKIIPELEATNGFKQYNPNHDKDVFEHILAVVEETPKEAKVRLAALFHDIAKPKTFSLDENGIGHFYNHAIIGMDITKEIMTRLKFDSQMISDVMILVKEHMNRHKNIKSIVAKRFINRVGVHNLEDLFHLMIADTLGGRQLSDFSDVIILREMCESVLNEKQPLTLKDLAINGKDLIELGIPVGQRIGVILNQLLEVVLNDPSMNEKEKLLLLVDEM